MIDRCELDARNIDLRNKVKRKQRQRPNLHNETNLKLSKIGHLYNDYLEYIKENDCTAVEMDCVEGTKEDKATLLTLHFTTFIFNSINICASFPSMIKQIIIVTLHFYYMLFSYL